tara:strand:- start:793 stop:2184 length:1392 start_codon:yes stop_codon:yes gene_type:complete
MGYQGYQGYGPKSDIAQLLIQQQAAQANGMKGGPMAAGANLGAIPDIGSAEQQAGSSRKIADLLMDRAMSRNQQGDVVNWGTGLGQIGEALLARNANKKADSADAKYADIKSALMKQAGQGNMDALFQLDPAAAMAQKNADRTFGYTKEQDVLANTRADRGLDLQGRGVDLQERGLDQSGEQFDARMDMDRDQFGQTMDQRGQFHEDEMGLSWAELEARKAEAAAKAQADAAEAQQGGRLAGLPAGVQSAIVGNELKNIDQAGSAAESASKAAALARRFVDESKDWNSQGGGWWNDLGQVFSNKTAGLKGITAEMVPMMRSAGEGIMTDADAKRYESAVVSINKPKSSNEDVAAVFAAAEQNAKAHEDFLRGIMASGDYGAQQEAQRIWDAYAKENPIFDAKTGQPVPDRVSIEQWVQGATGSPQGGTATEFDAADQIPEGATVEDENGVRWRKQSGQLVRAN